MKPQDLSKRQAAKIIDAAQQDIADRKEKLPTVHCKFDRNLLYAQIESRQAIIKRLNAIHFATILLLVFFLGSCRTERPVRFTAINVDDRGLVSCQYITNARDTVGLDYISTNGLRRLLNGHPRKVYK